MATPASAMLVELIGVGAEERPRKISPTWVADIDFSSAIDENDDALWDDANSPLNRAAWAIKSHQLKDMRNEHLSLIWKRVTNIFAFTSRNREQYHKDMTDFVKTFSELTCYNAKEKKLMGCVCLRAMQDIYQAAAFLVDFGLMTKGEKDCVLKEWIISRKAVRGEVSYGLRIGTYPRNNNQLPMGNLSFLNLLCIGKTRWSTLLKTKLKLGPNRHGNMEMITDQETLMSLQALMICLSTSICSRERMAKPMLRDFCGKWLEWVFMMKRRGWQSSHFTSQSE